MRVREAGGRGGLLVSSKDSSRSLLARTEIKLCEVDSSLAVTPCQRRMKSSTVSGPDVLLLIRLMLFNTLVFNRV